MQLALRKKGYYRIILGREVEPHHPSEKKKFMNRLDEAFSYLCTHISRDLLFHLEGLRTPKEAWEKLEILFGKKNEIHGHILENALIALQPSSFDTIQQFFAKFKSLALQCRQCGIERKDEQHVLSIITKLGSKYYIFVSTFHYGRASISNWNISSLDIFFESLIQKQEKFP